MKKKSCPVAFTHAVFDAENAVLAAAIKGAAETEKPRVLIVADANFVQRNDGVGLKIGSYMQRHGLELAGSPVVFGGGERLKTDGFGSVMSVISAAVRAMLGEGGVMLAIGGGSLFDVVGMAATMACGGVPVVRVPTTPAAMNGSVYCDTCAIDVAGVKDAARLASIPAAVVIDISLASTVLDGVWNGGFGEAVRVASVTDAALVRRLAECAADYRKRDLKLLEEVVGAVYATRQKKTVPPFAEWVAKRLQAMSGWKLPHGYAIPMGIAVESAYSVAKGWLGEEDRAIILKALYDSGAMDGVGQSRSFLTQVDALLQGIVEWSFAERTDEICYISGLGKCRMEPSDVETYRAVLPTVVL